jgi:hypothetical protein
MKPLTEQEQKVYDYILRNRGCTTRDIIRDTFVTCPSGRITEMRRKGVPIVSIGQRKYSGARAFECYAIEERKPIELPKVKQLALPALAA